MKLQYNKIVSKIIKLGYIISIKSIISEIII